jgi:hypothetical protein
MWHRKFLKKKILIEVSEEIAASIFIMERVRQADSL